MSEIFHMIHENSASNLKKDDVNKFQMWFLWTAWILSLVQFMVQNPNKNELPTNISEKTKKMYSILQNNFLLSHVMQEVTTNNLYLTTEFPFVDPNIFLSNHEENKINVRLVLLILSCLLQFKQNHLKCGALVCFYNNLKVTLEHLSMHPKFKLIYEETSLPTLKRLCCPTKGNWIEKEIDLIMYKNEFTKIVEEASDSHHKRKKFTGIRSRPLLETTHFLKTMLFLYSSIDWSNPQIYEHTTNRIFCYYFSICLLFILTGPLSGSRNLIQVAYDLFNSNLKIFREKIATENIEDLIQELENEYDNNPKIGFLRFIQMLVTTMEGKKNFADFILQENRNNINPEKGEKGIIRTSSELHTHHKKINKSKDKRTVTQETFLACGCTRGQFQQTIQSSCLCKSQLPSLCSFCVLVRIGVFLNFFICKKQFSGNVEVFHDFLHENKVYANEDTTALSYLLEIDVNGDLQGKKIKINRNNNTINLPVWNEATGKFVLQYLDPGKWMISNLLNEGFLIIDGQNISFHELLKAQIRKTQFFSTKWFHTLDIMTWLKNIQKIMDENENWIIGCYSLRNQAIEVLSSLGVSKRIMNSFGGWVSKESTMEQHYSNDSDLRADSSIQIQNQENIFIYLLFSDFLDYFMNYKSIQQDQEMKKLIELFHPLNKPC
jgi:hypothetical protein